MATSVLSAIELDFVKGDALQLKDAVASHTPVVVEFWATWCPPCRTSIPHLTALQHKFPSIKFIGVSNEARSVVEPFVAKMAGQMDYRVACDVNGSANRELMAKFGARGIPTAFIIDKTGKIVFNGHPMDGAFEAKLEAVANQRAPAAKNSKTRAELEALSVKELKDILAAHSISAVGCVEKSDVVQRVLDHCS